MPDDTPDDPQQIIADLQREVARYKAERDEALGQQTATAEVLQVINSSPGDLAPVFAAMLERATRLCEAAFGVMNTYDAGQFHTVALYGVPPALEKVLVDPATPQPSPNSPPMRLTRGEDVIHVDLATIEFSARSDPRGRGLVELGGARSFVIVGLRKDGRLLGSIAAYHQETRPFTENQIALLQNFAAQAVIAMENARLITETHEALDQQTATAEVLQVINSSPGDLRPVFEAILDKAHTLCGATRGILFLFDGETFRAAVTQGYPPELAEQLRQGVSGSQPAFAPLLAGARLVHIPDLSQIDDPLSRVVAERGGVRTNLLLPLRRDGALLGMISCNRHEVRPFSDREIALLENFGAQAVIAMENARLITETREALDQQTATAEVLQVINSSPGDLQPVFDTMLEKAMRLCDAAFGSLWTNSGDRFLPIAHHGVPAPYAEYLAREVPAAGPGTGRARLLAGEPFAHIADLADEEMGEPHRRALVDLGGARTALLVPLRKDEAVIGLIMIYRREIQPFTDKQIALLQNFAAQAVIAMENARLLTETREALDQQTATAEVLGVINASPGNLTPVFEAIIEKAHYLCGATQGSLFLRDGELFHPVSMRGIPEPFAEQLRRGLVGSDAVATKPLLAGERYVHIVDMAAVDHPVARIAAEQGHVRTLLSVPLRKDDELIGMIVAARAVVQPFSDTQIALLQNFAAQAVIAMENARLITETKEALDQQTATAEVLGVINASPGDPAPVFDAMLERAMRLCRAAFGELYTYDENGFHTVGLRGIPPAYAEYRASAAPIPNEGTAAARILAGEHFVHIADLKTEDAYKNGEPSRVAMVDLGGARTAVFVALLKEDEVRGAIVIYRQEVRPFSEKEIALLQNFAAQAVIAMENARLLSNLRERTDDLQQSLEYQTATSDVLKVMSGSAFELAPVLQTVVSTAVRLCRADQATVYRLDDGEYRWAADHSLTPDYERIERNVRIRPGIGTLVGRVALNRETVQILDAWTDPLYEVKEDARVGGVHTMLGVPLLREGLPIGVIGLARRRIEAYNDKEIELVRTFADQAVIAVENARLLSELRERTDELAQRQAELRVTFDNMADGVVMFDEELRLAAWNRNFQELLDLPDTVLAERPSYPDYLRLLAERGEFGTDDIEAELGRRLEHTDEELRLERTRPDGRVIEVRRNAVPDGGFVLIYSDITERKRSEVEIRTARDAAEAALGHLKAAQANLIQAEKMASLGQLTAGIAHEIKNPLNFVNNFASLSVELLEDLREATEPVVAALDEDRRADVDETIEMLTGNLEKIAEHGKRADNIVKSMLEHSRGVTGERREVDLNTLIDEALNLAYHGARAQDQTFNITLERDFDQALPAVKLAPQEITRVFLNLFGNGFYAANKRAREDGDGSFRPALTVATRGAGDAVEVTVRDNGTGIPPEIKDKLFQPFFTTKPTGEGTGLGLSISYDIITQQHGGTITVESEPGSFTEFTVRLPRHQ